MALSGSFIGAGGTSSPGVNYQLRVDWSATQDYASNTSTITCTFYLVQNPSWSISIGSRSNKCIIDGVAIAWTSPTVSNGGGTTTQIGSCSRVVSHNADGSKSLNITAVYATAPLTISGVYISEITASADITLDSIPRSSTPTVSASSATMRDGSVRIYTNRASTGFTHKLSYTFGNASGTIATGVTDSYSWTPPLALASQIPNATTGTAIITCTTYSGSTQIGNPQQTTVQLVVPSNVVPTASASWSDASGAFDLVGAYAQNVTNLSVAVTGTGAYGSSITGASMTLNGKAYTGGVITDSGELELLVTVKDSRGRLGSTPYTITVAPYTAPAITLSASRCQEDGTADDTGAYAKITLTGSTTQVNNSNTAALELTYGGTKESVAVSVDSFTYTKIVSASAEETMAISATLSDKLLTTTRTMTLSTGYATLDFLKGGKGIAFGKTATEEGFACAMDTDFCEHKVTGVQLYYRGSNGIDLDNVRSNIFATNAKNAPFSHGAVTCYRLQGGGFTPTDTIIQEMEEWSTHNRARRKSFDGGATWQPWENEALRPYPVGAIYMSLNGTSPASLFGGTWEQLKDRFLLGAGDSYAAGAMGGAASITHRHEASGGMTGGYAYFDIKDGTKNVAVPSGQGGAVSLDTTSITIAVRSYTSEESFNNMPPYLAVYMWKRVA